MEIRRELGHVEQAKKEIEDIKEKIRKRGPINHCMEVLHIMLHGYPLICDEYAELIEMLRVLNLEYHDADPIRYRCMLFNELSFLCPNADYSCDLDELIGDETYPVKVLSACFAMRHLRHMPPFSSIHFTEEAIALAESYWSQLDPVDMYDTWVTRADAPAPKELVVYRKRHVKKI